MNLYLFPHFFTCSQILFVQVKYKTIIIPLFLWLHLNLFTTVILINSNIVEKKTTILSYRFTHERFFRCYDCFHNDLDHVHQTCLSNKQHHRNTEAKKNRKSVENQSYLGPPQINYHNQVAPTASTLNFASLSQKRELSNHLS